MAPRAEAELLRHRPVQASGPMEAATCNVLLVCGGKQDLLLLNKPVSQQFSSLQKPPAEQCAPAARSSPRTRSKCVPCSTGHAGPHPVPGSCCSVTPSNTPGSGASLGQQKQKDLASP